MSLPPIYRKHLTANPPGVIRGEEQHAVRDVIRRAQALEGDALDQFALAFLAVSLPLAFGGGVGAHEAGRDAVDGDLPGAEFVPKLTGEGDDRRLRRRIRLDACQADGRPAPLEMLTIRPYCAAFIPGATAWQK